MKTIDEKVEKANTATVEGRQIVANACREFYKEIEKDVHKVGSDWMLSGLYSDLCEGNFSEPFPCEMKKETLVTCVAIYNERILPRL